LAVDTIGVFVDVAVDWHCPLSMGIGSIGLKNTKKKAIVQFMFFKIIFLYSFLYNC
jgi:hypothetical protein